MPEVMANQIWILVIKEDPVTKLKEVRLEGRIPTEGVHWSDCFDMVGVNTGPFLAAEFKEGTTVRKIEMGYLSRLEPNGRAVVLPVNFTP